MRRHKIIGSYILFLAFREKATSIHIIYEYLLVVVSNIILYGWENIVEFHQNTVILFSLIFSSKAILLLILIHLFGPFSNTDK